MNTLVQAASPAFVLYGASADQQRSYFQRMLAVTQQLKDGAAIVALLATGLLWWDLAFGVALPGLLLHVLRWKQVTRYGSRPGGAVVWGLGLAHELACVGLFRSGCFDSVASPVRCFETACLLGAGTCLVALLNLAWTAKKALNFCFDGPQH